MAASAKRALVKVAHPRCSLACTEVPSTLVGGLDFCCGLRFCLMLTLGLLRLAFLSDRPIRQYQSAQLYLTL